MFYHFLVTKDGKPLYNSEQNYTGFFFYLSNYGINIYLSVIISSIIFMFYVIYNKNKNSHFIMIFTIFVFIVIFSLLIFKKGMPTTRELIPFYSLFSFSAGELYDLMPILKNKKIYLH